MIEFKCQKCHSVVAKRDGDLLYTDGQVMSLFNSGFAFQCVCGHPFYFDLRRVGPLPERRQVSFVTVTGAVL